MQFPSLAMVRTNVYVTVIIINPSGRISPKLFDITKQTCCCLYTRTVCLNMEQAFEILIEEIKLDTDFLCRNIRFTTQISLVSSIQSLARIAGLCYSLEISHGWIFCCLSCKTRSSTLFSILDSPFAQESRIANQVKNRDSQQTVNSLQLHVEFQKWA